MHGCCCSGTTQRYRLGESRADCIAIARAAQAHTTHSLRCSRRHPYSVAAVASTCDALLLQTARAAQTMHRYGSATAATEHAPRQREQRRLWRSDGNNRASSATASMADYASLRRSNGSDRASIATARAEQTMQGYNGALVAATEPANAAQTMRSNGSNRACIAMARATEHVLRREQGRLCIATAKQRQRHIMHYDGESSVG